MKFISGYFNWIREDKSRLIPIVLSAIISSFLIFIADKSFGITFKATSIIYASLGAIIGSLLSFKFKPNTTF